MDTEEQEFISQYEAVLSSEMIMIRNAQYGLRFSKDPGASREHWRLQIIYEYMRDRLLATNVKNEKRLH